MHIRRTAVIFTMAILLATNLATAHQTPVKPTSAIDNKYQLTINQIANNVFLHVSYKNVKNYGMVAANGLIITKGKHAYIIDTPWTQVDTEKLVTWIKAQGLTPVSSISTHFHADRASGIPYLNKVSIDTYASEFTNQLLETHNKQAAKHHLLSSGNQLEKQIVAEGTVEIFYPGAGHSPDNIVVWLPEHKLLFGGCFVKSLNSKSLGYIGDADITKWPTSLQRLIDMYPKVKQVVPGHGKIGDSKLLTHTQALAINARGKVNLDK